MGQRFVLEPLHKGEKNKDFLPLLLVVIVLLGLGLATLLSASYYRGSLVFGDPYYFFKNQLMFLLAGALGSTLLAILPLEFIRKCVPIMVAATLILLLLVFIPGLGLSLLGGRRWIQILGFTFQPSDLAKVSLVLYLAFLLSKKQEQMGDLINTILPPFLVSVIFGVLVLLQNDYSTGMYVFFIAFLMFFAAGARISHLLGLLGIGVLGAAIALFSKESRVERLISFIAPERDPIGSGYQVLSSQAALMGGGLSGRGIGQGLRKLGGLPEANSDYIFAVLGEELGFIGVIAVMGLFAYFAYCGYRLAFRNGRNFAGLAAFGLTSSIVFQVLINLGVVSGLLPPTGITLPFFSSGGSSLIMALACVGLMINFARHPGGEQDG